MFARHIHMRPDARPRKKLSRPYRDAWSIGEMENEFHRVICRLAKRIRVAALSLVVDRPRTLLPRFCDGSATAECHPSELIRVQEESVGAGDGG